MVKLETLKINQTIVHDSVGSTFFSYDSPIATKHHEGAVTLYTDWAYSPTTSKYRSIFLGESTAETRKKLVNNTYQLKRPYDKN